MNTNLCFARILARILLLAFAMTMPTGAATFFSENFNGASLNTNLQDPQGRFAISGGSVHLTSSTGISDRAYVSTVSGDWTTSDFVFEITLNSPFDSNSILFVGLGPGTLNSNYQNEPDNALYLRIHSPDFVGGTGDNRGRVDVASLTGISPATLLGNDFGRLGTTPGVHRIRLTKSGNTLTFAIDKNYTGTFSPDMSYIVANIFTTAPFITGTNSRLFFGGARTSATWDDLSITTLGGSTGPVRLTSSPFDDTAPKWHPSNGKIAYHRLNGSAVMELGSVNSDATGEGLMVGGLVQPPYGYTTLISWLGSTNTLLCVETNTFHELLALNSGLAPFTRTVADGNDAAFTRKLFVPGGRYSNCFVASRDGGTVAWRDQPNAGGTNTLTIRSSPYIPLSGQDSNAFGTVVLTATDPSIGTRGMALSPDGSKLVISMPSGSGFDLWAYNTTGVGAPVQLTTDGLSGNLNLNADISPDGTKILYQHNTGAPGSSDLWLMNLDGSGKTNLTQTNGVDESAPSWGPDGTQYAFARIDSTESNIYRDSLPVSSVVTINFDNLTEGTQASNFLAAYGVPSVTFSGAPQSQGPAVTSNLGNSIAPSPPNILYQTIGANEQNQPHVLTFNFNPYLTAFSLDRVGKFGFGSTDTWHADFYSAAGVLLGSIGESTPLINAPVQTFGFTAPTGQTIARMDLVSIWTGFATNATIPVDNFVLTRSGTYAGTNANLSNLTFSNGTLSPTFNSSTTGYTATVGYGVSSITVTPTVADSGATVKVNNVTVASDSASGPIALIVGLNTITTVVTAANGVTTNTYSTTVTRSAPSSNANLSNLVPSTGTLSPSFASGTASYAATVGYTASSLTVTPTVADSGATVKVNNVTVASGAASGAISLVVGSNTVTTVVTAADGVATSTYTLTVTRSAPSSNANLANLVPNVGAISPSFSSGETSYTASVAFSGSTIRFTPTTAHGGATVKVNNVTVTSGSASSPISLAVGPNTITTVVTAEDGVATGSYTVVVTRAAPSSISTLSGLSPNVGTLSPAFDGATTGYTVSVAYPSSTLRLTPTVTDGGATVKVNNVTVASGVTSGAISLSVGANTLTTVVTAEDGVTTSTYTVVVTRAVPSTNANLNNLVIIPATLSPSFSNGTTAYTSSVVYGIYSITVTPTVADGTATVRVNGSLVSSGNPSSAINLTVGENTITTIVTAQDGVTTRSFSAVVTREPLVFIWNGSDGNWSDNSKWTSLEAPPVGGNPPIGNSSEPMVLRFRNNPEPINASTPSTYTAINNRGNASGFSNGYFGITQLSLEGGPTGASGTGTNTIGSPTPGFADPNLFFVAGGTIVNSTSNGVDYNIQNYITANSSLNLTGNGTALVRFGGIIQGNIFIQPWTFPPLLTVTKTGTSTFVLPGSAGSLYTTIDLREGTLQTSPGTFSSGAITLGYSTSTSATLKIGTNSFAGGGLADSVDITVVAGPPGSTRVIQNLSTASNESASLAGDLIIQSGTAVRLNTGASTESTMSLGTNGSLLSGGGDLIVTGSGRLFINPLTDNSAFTGHIIVESGSYQVPPSIPGGGGFIAPPTTMGGGEMSFTAENGTYPQAIVVSPPVIGGPPPVFNVTDNGTLAGLLTMNGGADMTIASGKNFVFDGGLSGAIPIGQSLNLNATGTGFVALQGDNSGLAGVIDFGKDTGTTGSTASLIVGGATSFPNTVFLNVFSGKLVFAPPASATTSGAIDFKTAAPGATPPELVLENNTPAVPKSVVLTGAITYDRGTLVRVNGPTDQLGLTGTLTSSTPQAGIEKLGPGTLILNPLGNSLPPDNFSAPTSVTAGTLKVNRDLSGSAVSVASGAILGGSGTVGALSVVPGAIIAPGNSPGTLTTSSASLSGGTLAVEIDGPLCDKLVATGVLNLTGSTLTVTLLGAGFTQGSYVIAQGNPLIGTFATVPGGYTVTYSATQATLTQSGGSSSYTTWITGYNSPPLSPADQLATADPDHDGISNLMEFVLGGNPVTPSSGILPVVTMSDANVVFAFKRSDASESVATLSVELSNDLSVWTTLPPIPVGPATAGAVTIVEHDAANDDVTVAIPTGGQVARFFRLKIVSPGP